MQQINFKYLNGGYFAIMIDGEEIGVVYKKEHAVMIETATTVLPQLEHQIENLTRENSELTILNNRYLHAENKTD